jgi:hypothetical protein
MPIENSTLWRTIGRWEAERDSDHRRIDQLEPRVEHLEQQVGTLMTWATRGGLLIGLWVAAIALNLAPEQKAEVVSLILQRLAK